MNKFSILIVDDEENMLKMLKTFFEEKEFKCYTAKNGREALEVIEANKVDLVITDMKMPEMDGLELLRVIKEKYNNISAVIMTGFAEEYTTTEALNLGADGYITKPFRNKELLLILKRIQQLNQYE
ncbi:MAG: response regulator [Candidatus Delongbacteria bacterium]|jgi:YesN/AraC family two-component response regulator|nr:response regulator [Candidatus Delongbacteria bacterium]MDD4205256.1 response regulator [Candidatus Delongbacteria bacterium]MDY0017498.1 response regulator [Candidatus Delongbacteria bacterium]